MVRQFDPIRWRLRKIGGIMIMKEDKTKILMIDDSKEVLIVLERFFKRSDCKVFTALSGEEGLALATQHNFTVVLIDILMPGIGGEETLVRMKKIHPNIPIIMITGYDDEEEAKKCMKLGAYDYIHKPFDFEYLKTSVLSTEMLV